MRLLLAITMCCFWSVMVEICFAQTPSPSPTPIVVSAPVSASPLSPVPPAWAQEVLVKAEELPVVGPYVANIIMYAGILAAVLTSIVVCLLGILNSLSGLAQFAGLAAVVAKVQAFKDGPIMYWLKYLSMFNAQKPATK